MSRRVVLLVRPTARTTRWVALVGGAAAAQGALWAAKSEFSRGEGVPLLPLRVAAVLLCLGAAFVLDDEAGATVEPAVVSLMIRRGLRMALAIPLLGLAWGGTLWVASRLAASGGGTVAIKASSLPVGALTLEAAALLAVTLASGAVGTRSLGHGKGGVAAGPTLLAFVVAMVSIQRYWDLFPSAAGGPGWTAAHVRWAIVLFTAGTVLAWFSLDPARRSKVMHRGRPPGTQRVERVVRVPVGGKP
jgi:hypothetical protein